MTRKSKRPPDGYGAASDSFLTRARHDALLRDGGRAMLDQATRISHSDLLDHIELFCATGDEDARNYIVVHNLRLVRSIAKRFVRPGIELDDLMTWGIFGLMRAVEKYNPSLDIQFSTYATPAIRRSIHRHILNEEHVIRQSTHQRKLRKHLTAFVAEFKRQTGLAPTISEIATGLDVSLDRIRDYFLSCNSQSTRPQYAAQPGSHDVDTFAITSGSAPTPEAIAIAREKAASIRILCDRYIELFAALDITPRTRELAERWFGVNGYPPDQTLKEVCAAMSIRIDWARQSMKAIARRMQRHFDEWQNPRWLKCHLAFIEAIDARKP